MPSSYRIETVLAGGLASLRSEPLVGVVDGINTAFTTVLDFIAGTETVFYDGVRMQEGLDYTRSESGGAGTGFDTITFTAAPLSRALPKSDTIVSITYVPSF